MNSALEVLLTAITVAVAIIGVKIKDPKPRVQYILIGLALLAGAGSIYKSWKDAHDKDFVENALVSTLSPSNASYTKLTDEIEHIAEDRKFDYGEKNTCHHNNTGLTCFLYSSTNPNAHATLVFNHDEVARMYASDLEHKSNDVIINAAFAKHYQRKPWNEDYVDKVGVLGSAVCYNMFHRFAEDYNYDYSFGIAVECDAAEIKIKWRHSQQRSWMMRICPTTHLTCSIKSRAISVSNLEFPRRMQNPNKRQP